MSTAMAATTRADSHPGTRLDETIHAPVRLSVTAALAAADRVEFRDLRDLLQVSDLLLSKHMSTLETAGYIEVIEGYQGRRPRTWLALTETGRAVYADYLAALRQVLGTRP